MRKALLIMTAVTLLTSASVPVAQAQTSERFGLGMFAYQNRTFVGVVVRYPTEPQQIGGYVVELPAAARAANVTGVPGDLLSIMDQWSTVGPKIKQIVAKVSPTIAGNRPAYMYDYKAVDALRPFVPRLAFYGFSNYRPVPGTPPPAQAPKIPPSMPGIWERAANDTRPQNPRLFMIPNTPEVFIGDGDPVINWAADRRKDYKYRVRDAWDRRQADAPRARGPGEKLHVRLYKHQRHLGSPGACTDPIRQDWLVQKGWDSLKTCRSVRRPAGVRRSVEHEPEDDGGGNAGAELEHQSGMA